MPQLSFKQRFVAPILSGAKRQTIRDETSLAVGDLVSARCRYCDPPFARLLVTAVEWIRLGDLTDRDARADDLADLAEMRAMWGQFYPHSPWRNDRHVYRIRFEVYARRKNA